MEFKNIEQINRLYDDQPGFLSSGLYFGFPICCIDAFCSGETQTVIKNHPLLESSGTGFVPCLECAKEVAKDWPNFLAEKILKNRICQGAWPDGDNAKDKTEFFKFFIELTRALGYDPKEEAQALHPKFEKQVLKILKQEEKDKKVQEKESSTLIKVKVKR